MRQGLTQRIADGLRRREIASAPHMKELEIYGAVAVGGLVFLIILFRLLTQ